MSAKLRNVHEPCEYDTGAPISASQKRSCNICTCRAFPQCEYVRGLAKQTYIEMHNCNWDKSIWTAYPWSEKSCEAAAVPDLGRQTRSRGNCMCRVSRQCGFPCGRWGPSARRTWRSSQDRDSGTIAWMGGVWSDRASWSHCRRRRHRKDYSSRSDRRTLDSSERSAPLESTPERAPTSRRNHLRFLKGVWNVD